MGTQMRCRWPPRRDHCSIFGRNRSNPFAASWSLTRSSQWLRVHNACHAVDERTAPSWTAAVSRAGEIRSVGVTLFIGWASPPLVRGSLSGTNHTHLRSEEHTSELQSPCNLVCRLLLEKKKTKKSQNVTGVQQPPYLTATTSTM